MSSEPLGILATFREQVLRDRLEGNERSLAWYQQRFRGFEEVIAEEYGRLSQPDPASDPEPGEAELGSRIGPFELERELGRGGQGRVFLARDTRLGRPVALKVLTRRVLDSPDREARFRREAVLGSRLEHPSIATVYEAGSHDGAPWVAMQLVEGESLAEHVRRDRDRSPFVLSIEEVHDRVRVFEGAVRAVHAAHQAGILHRDLKPGNLMITPEERAVVLDFGLARELEGDGGQITLSGEVFGTPSYMAPEQIESSTLGVDERTDVYALGATLFEWLTARRPFTGATEAALFRAVLQGNAPSLRALQPSVPRDLDLVVSTAMSREPRHRYATALDLADDLAAVLENRSVAVRAPGPAERAARWARRDPRRAALVFGLVVALLAAAGSVGFFFARRDALEEGQKAILEREVEHQLVQSLGFGGGLERFQQPEVLRPALQANPDLALARAFLANELVANGDAAGGLALLDTEPADEDQARAFERIRAIAEERPTPEWERPAGPLEQYVAGKIAARRAEKEQSVEQSDRALEHIARALLMSPRAQQLFHVEYAIALFQNYAIKAKVGGADPYDRINREGPGMADALTAMWPDSPVAVVWAAYAVSCQMKPDENGVLQKDLERTAALHQRAVELDPHLAESMTALTFIALERQDWEEAQAWYERTLATVEAGHREEPEWYHTDYASGLIAFGRPDLALEPLQRALEAKPEYPRALILLGRVHLETARAARARGAEAFDEIATAIDTLNRAVEAAPDSRDASVFLRAAYRAADERAAVRSELERWTTVTPTDADAWDELIRLLLGLDEREAARRALEAALASTPDADPKLREHWSALLESGSNPTPAASPR